MVDFLQKLTGSEEFHQIVDFLAGSHIREQQLTVTVDGQTITITEASVRRHLQFVDADGISSLPNTEIFDQFNLMGYVSNDDKLTFQKVGEECQTIGRQAKVYCSKEKGKAEYEGVEIDLNQTDDDLQRRSIIKEIDLGRGFTLQQLTPIKVKQGYEQSQESFKAQLGFLSATKILAGASRERVKTYTRRRSTDNLRDSTAGGLFSTAKGVQGKEHISTDKKIAQKLNDEEMVRAAAREKQERTDFKKALELQKEKTNNIDWNIVAEQKDTEVKKTKTKRIAEETLLQESFKKLRTTKASRVRNIIEAYQVFEDMLKGFDREDLVTVWSLVKERFRSAEPIEDKERALWVELKRFIKPNKDDVLWKLQRYMYNPLTWRLYGTCRVHHVSSTRGHDIYMLIEKDYPLSNAVLNLMLSRMLQVEEDSEMARDLIMKIFTEANKPIS
ncbi:hypothetical protein Tco_0356449 [Tanacetum coccineum]